METIAGLGIIGVSVFLLLLALLTLLLPFSAYAAQKWAHKNYLESKSINSKLGEIIEILREEKN